MSHCWPVCCSASSRCIVPLLRACSLCVSCCGQILCVMCESKGESLAAGLLEQVSLSARRNTQASPLPSFTHPLTCLVGLSCVRCAVALHRGQLPALLSSLAPSVIESQNAGLISNWVSFAQMERDDRIDLTEAESDPQLACTLHRHDFEKAVPALQSMAMDTNKKRVLQT